jgi:hypothetical protein
MAAVKEIDIFRIDRGDLRARGAIKEFTKAYRLRRMAAKTRGEGFMSFKVAEARLRLALIPLLVGGQNVGRVQSLFAEIFDRVIVRCALYDQSSLA